MWPWLWAKLLSYLFGDGLGAEIAGRGTVYLVDEARKAIDKDEERLTGVRIRPGETFTVIARPPATREERKLAASQRRLRARDDQLSRPSRRQLRAARHLRTRQRRLDRRRPGTRRFERARRKEAAAGARFDKVMRPSKRQAAVRAELETTTVRLDAARDVSMAKVRAKHPARRRRRRPTVYE